MTPNDIYTTFREKWVGTEEELTAALEYFYNDVRDSVELALKRAWPLSGSRGDAQQQDVLEELDDYFTNHYGA